MNGTPHLAPHNASNHNGRPPTATPASNISASGASASPSNRSNTTTVNGTHHHASPAKGKKKNDQPVDPAAMYESVKSRIAALEEEEVLEEEDERRFAEEAQKSVKGLDDSAIHAKYIELFAELKRLERTHAKEKQKLVKDKDAAKSQLTKANQTKVKMENLARELQKDNKRLREDGKRLTQSIEDAQDELAQMKSDIRKRTDKAKLQDDKYREMPDIVVKVVCRYRAELFFKISRKTKLAKLFHAWTDRMEKSTKQGDTQPADSQGGSARQETSSSQPNPSLQFIYTYNGRTIDADQTPESIGIEDGDEILAVELMDLTEGPVSEELADVLKPCRPKLIKNWFNDPQQAAQTLEELFDGVVRERLKEVLRLYELRERHFECVIRSKELEVLLSRARATEQKQLAEGERFRASKLEEEMQQLRKDVEDAQNGQTMLIDKLIQCCKEPNAERTQRLFASLREELEKRSSRTPNNIATKKPQNGAVGG